MPQRAQSRQIAAILARQLQKPVYRQVGNRSPKEVAMVAVVPAAETVEGPKLIPSYCAPTKTPREMITEADQIRDRLAHLLDEITKMIARTHALLHELEARSERFEKVTSIRRKPF